jgi:exonuclease III
MKIATWNVQTLAHKGDKGEEDYVGKFFDWEQDFDNLGLDIIAMQETRVKGINEFTGRKYKLYLAGQDPSEVAADGSAINRQNGTGFVIKRELADLTL